MLRRVAFLSLLSMLSLIVALCIAPVAATAAPVVKAAKATPSGVTSSSLGTFKPTFVGPAATGCNFTGCSLLSGPTQTGSTANLPAPNPNPTGPDTPSSDPDVPRALKLMKPGGRSTADPAPPSVSCPGAGCDSVSTSAGGSVGVKGLNAVDSGTQSTNVLGVDIEPADQGLCAGNGYVVEDNNLGEILIFNTALGRVSSVIPLDTLMGLTTLGWSSGGDISCTYDYSNGGHWFFTEFVSTNSEASGGTFAGCFAGVAHACHEGIAVTRGNSPFGPYNVYFVNADYNPQEPGYPYLLNDFAKIATTRDAFLLFYDEFPLVTAGLGGGGFNGAYEFAFDKKALELGLPTTWAGNRTPCSPSPSRTWVSCQRRTERVPGSRGGVTCWFSVIPAVPPDPTQYDNSHCGSGFMLDSLDFFGQGDNRIAVFDWTGLANLNTFGCFTCFGIHFGGQLFSGVEPITAKGQAARRRPGRYRSG